MQVRSIHTFRDVLQAQIEHGIVHGTSHQELQTEIIHALAIGKSLTLLRLVPVGDQAITEGQRGGRVGGAFITVVQTASERSLNMTDNLLLESIDIREALYLMLGPSLSLGLGN